MDKNISYLLKKIDNPNLTTAFIIAENSGRQITELRIRTDSNIKIKIDGQQQEIMGTYHTRDRLYSVFLNLCDNTISAYEEQISKGYITLGGGIRVGIGGRFYRGRQERPQISQVTSLNIRIPGKSYFAVPGEILDLKKGILILGKPHSGKTTMLKSLCRSFSGYNIAVCDERNELSNFLTDCDCISGINKAEAIQNATRAMSPDIIVCDEIGGRQEAEGMLSAVNSGVKFICTAHCGDIASAYSKPNIALLLNAGIFDKVVLLKCEDNSYFIREIADV